MGNKELVEREAIPYTPTMGENRRDTADLNTVRHVYLIWPYIKRYLLQTAKIIFILAITPYVSEVSITYHETHGYYSYNIPIST